MAETTVGNHLCYPVMISVFVLMPLDAWVVSFEGPSCVRLVIVLVSDSNEVQVLLWGTIVLAVLEECSFVLWTSISLRLCFSISDGCLRHQVGRVPRERSPRHPRRVRGPRLAVVRAVPRVWPPLRVAQSAQARPQLQLLLVRPADPQQQQQEFIEWWQKCFDAEKRTLDFLVRWQTGRRLEKVGVASTERSSGHLRHLGKCLALRSQDFVIQGSQQSYRKARPVCFTELPSLK